MNENNEVNLLKYCSSTTDKIEFYQTGGITGSWSEATWTIEPPPTTNYYYIDEVLDSTTVKIKIGSKEYATSPSKPFKCKKQQEEEEDW